MEGQNVGAGPVELLHVAHGPLNHQVDVQGQGGDAFDGGHHRNADGEIGHEAAVHHVHVNVIGAGIAQSANVPLEIYEIRREDRRCKLDHSSCLHLPADGVRSGSPAPQFIQIHLIISNKCHEVNFTILDLCGVLR